jgi:DNA-binding transcriptional ArsR family regulator
MICKLMDKYQTLSNAEKQSSHRRMEHSQSSQPPAGVSWQDKENNYELVELEINKNFKKTDVWTRTCRRDCKTEGRRKTSPGTIYPALKSLRQRGFISSDEKEGKTIVYTLTERGKNAEILFHIWNIDIETYNLWVTKLTCPCNILQSYY